MPFIDATTTEWGCSLPPQGPHTITTHAPGYKTAMGLRDGDMSIITRIKSIYPRFSPFGLAAQFLGAVGQQLALPEGYMCTAYLSPETWRAELHHGTSEHRKESRITRDDLKFRVVEIGGVRLYLVVFHAMKRRGSLFVWQHRGLGFSSRVAQALLPRIEDSFTDLGEFAGPDAPGIPEPTYLPVGESHQLLKERVAEYMNRATIQDYDHPVDASDVTLYQTGMAAIVRFHEAATKVRPGTVVVFGSIFHSTWHFLEENEHGFKHWGPSSDADLAEFEAYLEAGGSCSYVFTEFPSNPILTSLNLARLRQLADKYGFYIVVDDTLAGFANMDLLPVADVVWTSLTKAFSGYADVMGGSLSLNPNINNNNSYTALKAAIDEQFHNELFVPDADTLLSNSDDYLARCVKINRNANALAAFLHQVSQDPAYPVRRVLYPPYTAGFEHAKSFLRRPTADFPEPGFGPLLSVELETMDQMVAFYDNLTFHQGPHLGAHLTLCVPFNALVFGKDPDEAAYHAAYGSRQEQVRISVGFTEEAEDIIGAVQKALDTMVEVAGRGRRDEAGEKAVDEGRVLADEIEREVAEDGDVKTDINLMS
ncbi:pyridoxal phosphate-dependent transferase [Microdochium bolleyi]|uniref:Pyridoxal phosphate-dependent transferase n=1 Tax=Microdochium bolleyi TaxID=196109 RepID=A0A136JFT1_9PEZI|nr:pyridoxal phosphate-dependent transferase [Microdochium bolleyi]